MAEAFDADWCVSCKEARRYRLLAADAKARKARIEQHRAETRARIFQMRAGHDEGTCSA
jgi:hypothetical protein